MNLIEYVPLAIRTEKPLPSEQRLVHGCMGLITELKRMVIYGKSLDAERKANLLEEAGDVMWYTAILLSALRVNLKLVRTDPILLRPNDGGEEGTFAALSLMLGEHSGRVCGTVQIVLVRPLADNEDAIRVITTSLETIIAGLRLLCGFCGSDLEAAMADNIAKLRIRFPNAYSNEAAEGRADKAGVDARNS